MNRPNVLLFELNETNQQLLADAASQLNLQNLAWLTSLPVTQTETPDTYESDYLEPWVQWVSVHTGVPAQTHQIKHLGDVKNLEHPQIWETLSAVGISTGIWGVMNGERRNAPACKFFLADPWTFGDEVVYPSELATMTDLAVYISKNYLNLSALAVLKHGINYAIALLKNVGLRDVVEAFAIFFSGLFQFGPKNMVLGAFYEYTSAIAFLHWRKKYNPQLTIFFVNLIAHLQHHYWQPNTVSPQLAFGFRVIDKIVGRLRASLQQTDILLVANAFSQQSTAHEPSWILYRPHDPAGMVKAFRINFERVEALMTHDAHLFFASEQDCQTAIKALSEASVNGQKLFLVEPDAKDNRKLFYRLVFTDAVTKSDTIICNGVTLPFHSIFAEVVTRTGKHNARGFVFQSQKVLPDHIQNCEIYHYLCKHFGVALNENEEAPVACR